MVCDLAIRPLPIMATPSSGTGEVTCCRVIEDSRSEANPGLAGGRIESERLNEFLPCHGHCVRQTIHCTLPRDKQPRTPGLTSLAWAQATHRRMEGARRMSTPAILGKGWSRIEPADAGWTFISFAVHSF